MHCDINIILHCPLKRSHPGPLTRPCFYCSLIRGGIPYYYTCMVIFWKFVMNSIFSYDFANLPKFILTFYLLRVIFSIPVVWTRSRRFWDILAHININCRDAPRPFLVREITWSPTSLYTLLPVLLLCLLLWNHHCPYTIYPQWYIQDNKRSDVL